MAAEGIQAGVGGTVSSATASVGADVGASGVMGAVNATLDSIPIIGELVGIGTLIGGLIHGLHKKGLTAKEGAASSGSQATGGIDTSVFRGNTLGQSGGGTVV